MKLRTLALIASALALAACDRVLREPDGGTTPNGVVTIYSTADTAVFAPVIADFEKVQPNIRVRYVELDAQPLNQRYLVESAAGRNRADILLSAAMDLQVKLVNDGYAQPHHSANADALPSWARWRDEIFGLTFEPVVMVVNLQAMNGRPVPTSRFDLAQALGRDPAFWNGRIGTYDVKNSSTGYLLASQDDRLSSEFGPLVQAMGRAHVRVYQNSSPLLSDIESGKLLLGYNVLGSYAKQRIAAGARLRIVYPEDYTFAVIRAAFISKRAPNPVAAHSFLEYLLSLRGQRVLSTRSNLDAAREEIRGPYGKLGIAGRAIGPLRPIPLGPGLLTYLDEQKRERFLENWQTMLNRHS
jgi:iron(III) transport system substrate-binding protein